MKSLSDMSIAAATNEAASTTDPPPNTMPCGLSRNRRPLAPRYPLRTLAASPCTRLRTTDLLPGWKNWTFSSDPMSNEL